MITKIIARGGTAKGLSNANMAIRNAARFSRERWAIRAKIIATIATTTPIRIAQNAALMLTSSRIQGVAKQIAVSD